jgi:DNA polymerase I
VRAYANRALNRRLQGSSADQLKKAMSDGYKSGVFAEIGSPVLTVHDELIFSCPPDAKPSAFAEMKNIMEKAIPLRIPVVAEGGFGKNWRECK